MTKRLRGLKKASYFFFRGYAASVLTSTDGWWITGGYADYYTQSSTVKVSNGEFIYGEEVISCCSIS